MSPKLPPKLIVIKKVPVKGAPAAKPAAKPAVVKPTSKYPWRLAASTSATASTSSERPPEPAEPPPGSSDDTAMQPEGPDAPEDALLTYRQKALKSPGLVLRNLSIAVTRHQTFCVLDSQ